MPRPSLERLVVSCRMPGATSDDILYWRPLKIVEPSNKLIVLGATAGAITTLVLLAALYAPVRPSVRPGQPCPCRCAAITRSAPPQVLVRETRHEGEGGAALDRAAGGKDGVEPSGGGL